MNNSPLYYVATTTAAEGPPFKGTRPSVMYSVPDLRMNSLARHVGPSDSRLARRVRPRPSVRSSGVTNPGGEPTTAGMAFTSRMAVAKTP